MPSRAAFRSTRCAWHKGPPRGTMWTGRCGSSTGLLTSQRPTCGTGRLEVGVRIGRPPTTRTRPCLDATPVRESHDPSHCGVDLSPLFLAPLLRFPRLPPRTERSCSPRGLSATPRPVNVGGLLALRDWIGRPPTTRTRPCLEATSARDSQDSSHCGVGLSPFFLPPLFLVFAPRGGREAFIVLLSGHRHGRGSGAFPSPR